MAESSEPSDIVSRRQGFGCLGLALFSLLSAALFVFLGYRCLLTQDFFDCVGLLTVFPAVFVAIGLVSGAVGLQRFTTAGRQQSSASRLTGLESGWQSLAPRVSTPGRRAGRLSDVINLPPKQEPPAGRDNRPDEDEDA